MTRLAYCDDSQPGITRKKMRHGWGYWDAAGARITDRGRDRPAERYRSAAGVPRCVVLPEGQWAYPGGRAGTTRAASNIAIIPISAPGRDSAKYEGCATFGRKLPRLRAKVDEDLKLRGVSREKAVAAVVRLLDLGQIRVGNEGYVKSGNSFGATTLRNRHVKVAGTSLKLKFRAKSGKERVMTITDRSLSRFVKKCQDLPGQHLFQWLDDEGEPHPVSSSDVNEYIREAMDDDFTAKHFRTWSASVMAFEALIEADKDIGLNTMLEPVTAALGQHACDRPQILRPPDADRSGQIGRPIGVAGEISAPRHRPPEPRRSAA